MWSYDFVWDQTADGRMLKILPVVDEVSRECLAILVGRSITAEVVVALLERLIEEHGAPEFIRSVLPEAAHLDVEVHPLPNLNAVNVVIRGLLGEGVSASSRFDPQAKGLGEWLRSRCVEIPEELL